MQIDTSGPDVLAAVADQLKKRGFSAEGQNTGGNIFCVIVSTSTNRFNCGTANDTWGASVDLVAEGVPIGTLRRRAAVELGIFVPEPVSNYEYAGVEIDTTVSSDSQDVDAITDAIAAAVTNFSRAGRATLPVNTSNGLGEAFGTWPGDETDAELLGALDDLRHPAGSTLTKVKG